VLKNLQAWDKKWGDDGDRLFTKKRFDFAGSS
jgi:hypothetical protein